MASPVVAPPEPAAQEEEYQDNGYGERNEDLPEQLKRIAIAILRELQKRDLYDRRIEVLKDRLHRFYSDGIQHVFPNYGTGTYQIGTAGGYVDIGNRTIQCPDYMGDYNVVFYPNQRSLEAVLTQNPPGIDFEPDDPSLTEDIEAAEVGEGYRIKFDNSNDVKGIQLKVARMFCLSGRTIIEVETEANSQKWGLNDKQEPRKMETGKVYGTLESKVPIYAKDQDRCAFVILFDDPDVLSAKKDYPQIKSKISGGQGSPAESDWERWARLGVRQARKSYFLNGGSLSFVTTKTKAYLRPECYECACCDEAWTGDPENPGFQVEPSEEGKVATVRDALKQLFPDGWCLTLIGENYAESWNKSLDDCVVIGFPREGDGMTGRAMTEGLVVVQDSYNDKKNAEREAYEKGWPATWVSGQAVDYDALLNQRAEPYAFHEIKELRPGQTVEEVIYREPEMNLSVTFIQSMEEDAGSLPQKISGALPALQGETQAGDHTASKAAQDRSQAMGMLGMAWAQMQRMFARMYYMAALAATNNPDHSETIVVPSADGQTSKFQLAKLSKGHFHCHPNTDSSFPESTAAKRSQMDSILAFVATSPVGLTFLESPDNWYEILKLKGFPELTLTPAMAYEKQTAEIEILLQEQPVPPDPQMAEQAMMQHAQVAMQAEASGQPPPPFEAPQPQCSLPVGKYDYHKWEFAKCQEFLSSERCRRELATGGEQQQGNALGVKNVELHADLHKQAMMMEMMQQAALAPPPQGAPPAGPHKPPAAHAPEAATSVQKASTPPGAATV